MFKRIGVLNSTINLHPNQVVHMLKLTVKPGLDWRMATYRETWLSHWSRTGISVWVCWIQWPHRKCLVGTQQQLTTVEVTEFFWAVRNNFGHFPYHFTIFKVLILKAQHYIKNMNHIDALMLTTRNCQGGFQTALRWKNSCWCGVWESL